MAYTQIDGHITLVFGFGYIKLNNKKTRIMTDKEVKGMLIVYGVATVFALVMMFVANGAMNGVWQLAQIAAVLCAVSTAKLFYKNRQKATWYALGGMIFAFTGGMITPMLYVVLLGIMLATAGSPTWHVLDGK